MKSKTHSLPSIHTCKPSSSLHSRLNIKVQPFITELSNTKKTLPNELYRYYGEFINYIESFNIHLGNFLEKNESFYLSMYQKFVNAKTQEIIKLNQEMDGKIAEHSRKLYDKEIRQNKAEIVMLQAKLQCLTQFYNKLEDKFKKLKERTEHVEDENKFLKEQVRMRIQDNNNLQALLETINNDIMEVQSELSYYEDNETKCNKLIELFNRSKNILNNVQIPQMSLETVLNSIANSTLKKSSGKFKSNKVKDGEKKSNSLSELKNTKEGIYKVCVNKLTLENDLLKKRITFLKSKMGSSVYQRSEIEDIFVDCINMAKREIFKKRLKITSGKSIQLMNIKLKNIQTKNIANSIKKIKNSLQDANNVSYSDFTKEDKMNLVTLFVCNDKIMKHIYNLIFPRYEISALNKMSSYTEFNYYQNNGINKRQMNQESLETMPNVSIDQSSLLT